MKNRPHIHEVQKKREYRLYPIYFVKKEVEICRICGSVRRQIWEIINREDWKDMRGQSEE